MAFGFLTFPGVEELDVFGPWEMIATWSMHLGGPAPCLIIAQTAAAITCANGVVIQPNATFDDAPQLKCLLIPGGPGTRREVDNPVLIDYLQRATPACKALLSVCTGAFLLHAAGLARGHALTTHWAS